MRKQAEGYEPPSEFTMADGTWLSDPRWSTGDGLRIGDWVAVGQRAWRIRDLRLRPDGGRIVHLHGRPPMSLGVRDLLAVYWNPGRR